MEHRIEKYKDWKYRISDAFDEMKFAIIPAKTITIPATLNKYYAINKHNVESLENNEFYISQPEDFNDLFDTSYDILDFSELKYQEICNYIKQEQYQIIKSQWDTNREDALDFIKNIFYRSMLTRFGILCTAKNKDDELMWGYYNKNEGYLIEFNYKKFPNYFHGPFPVNYVPRIDKISITRIDHLNYLMQSNIKKDIWKHENEFRFLVESETELLNARGIWEDRELLEKTKNKIGKNINENRLIEYPKDSIVAIYLGFNFLKGEEIIQSNIPYKIKLVSDNKELKKRLLLAIINQKLICYSLIENVSNFRLEHERWEIKCKDTYEFEIQSLGCPQAVACL